MEEQLEKIVKRIEAKSKFKVIVSGPISADKRNIRTQFEPPLVFSTEACNYEMALTRLETYYSFPNINTTNNQLKISFDDKKTWKVITIPTGCYEIESINTTLQQLIKENGGEADTVKLSPNRNTLKCMLKIKKKSCFIDFKIVNCIRTVLGFDAKIYGIGLHQSQHLVDIMSVNSILVNCDIIGASRVNGVEAPIIYSFFPNVSPGEKIIVEPRNLIYVPVTLSIISHMTCWLTDQNKRHIDLQGEELTIAFHLKAC